MESIKLVLRVVRIQAREQPVSHHCVVEISRRCHRIAVEILPSAGTTHAAHKFNFCLDGALVYCPDYIQANLLA